VREELKKYDVKPNIINKLVKKLANNQPLDSMLYGEEQAVSLEKKETETGYEEIHTFADGSISVVGVELLDKINNSGEITTLGTGISGGSCSGGTGYMNCTNKKVYYSNPGVWEMSFRADYSFAYGGAYDSITWIGNWSIWQVGGTYSNPSLRYIKSKENSLGKAEARLSATLVLGSNYGTQTRSVSLLVGSDTASARGNNYY